MVRVVTFADGFISGSAPVVTGGQIDYTILNNQASFVNFSTSLELDGAAFSTYFINYEIERIDNSSEYRQSGTMIAHFDGADWSLEPGPFMGDQMIADSISTPDNVVFQISNASPVGTVQYKSGNMGAGYSGVFKVISVRMIL